MEQDASSRGRSWVFAAVLALIAVGALAGRLHRIEEVGVTVGDEATYYLTALSLDTLLEWGWQNRAHWDGGTEAGWSAESLRRHFEAAGVELALPYYSKPLFDVLNLGAFALWGESPDAIKRSNAWFSALAVVLMGLLGRRLFGTAGGLLAALFFALSGASIAFGRMGLAHMPSTALFLAGAWVYLGSWQALTRRYACLGAGFLWGAALAVHPNLVPHIGLVYLLEAGVALQSGQWRRGIERVGGLAAGTVFCLVAVQAAHVVFAVFFAPVLLAAESWALRPYISYFGQIGMHAAAVADGSVSLGQKAYTYLGVLCAYEGAVALVLACGLTAVLLVRRGDLDWKAAVLCGQLWIPLLFFIFSRNQAVFRYASGVVMVLPLVAAAALLRLEGRWGRQRVFFLPLAAVLVTAYSVWHISPLYQAESAWKTGAHWLRSSGVERVVARQGHLWAVNDMPALALQPGAGSAGSYLAVYRRYLRPDEEEWVELRTSGAPEVSLPHRRYGKIMEVQFVNNNPFLDLMQALPGIGPSVRWGRREVQRVNALRVLDIYRLEGGGESAVAIAAAKG